MRQTIYNINKGFIHCWEMPSLPFDLRSIDRHTLFYTSDMAVGTLKSGQFTLRKAQHLCVLVHGCVLTIALTLASYDVITNYSNAGFGETRYAPDMQL